VWQAMGNGWQWFGMLALMFAVWLVVVGGAAFVVWASQGGPHDEHAKVPAAAPLPEMDEPRVREEVLSGSR
jgi:hypothetical protein